MKTSKLSFIGAGNMTRSLVGGLIADGCDPSLIRLSDPEADRIQDLAHRLGVQILQDNRAVIEDADLVVLAVKPQVLPAVAREIADLVRDQRPLVISIAAGIRTPDLARWLGADTAIVRAMPNTPALVQSGATGLFANTHVSDEQRDLAETILRAVGLTLWVEQEDQLDLVTALSGSGPAYFFLVMEALQEAATKLGLPVETARLLALQTAFGASRMALESDEDAAALRQRVTSPGGTTEQALRVLEEGGLRNLMEQALTAAARRSRELADQFGAQ
ncbi:MAG TPA: pyrroline-5-carboxylate reductase [Gammaproteobacteria bacterium]|nr:pyrroline-5-carboxylate reductase [Gammaproteobacteria bacterium]